MDGNGVEVVRWSAYTGIDSDPETLHLWLEMLLFLVKWWTDYQIFKETSTYRYLFYPEVYRFYLWVKQMRHFCPIDQESKHHKGLEDLSEPLCLSPKYEEFICSILIPQVVFYIGRE